MLEPEEVLAEHPFFKGLSPEHLARLVAVAKPVHIEANRFIARQGGSADCFLILHHGDVALELHVPGKGARIIQTVHAGEVLGWSWLFPPYKWTFDARALNTVEAVCLEAVKLREETERDHEFGYQMLTRFSEVFVERLEATRLQLLDVYADHA